VKSIRLNLRKGFAIPFVVVVFVIVVTITGIMFNLFSNNLAMALAQERNIQAYYCAMTGIEMGTAALLTEPDPMAIGSMSLLEIYQNFPLATARTTTLSDTVTLPPGPDGTSMGNVLIHISAPVKPGASPDDLWIRVGAIGNHTDARGIVTPVRVSVWYYAANPAIFEQELGLDI